MIAYGKAQIVLDKIEVLRALNPIMEKYVNKGDFEMGEFTDPDNTCVVKIKVNSISRKQNID